MLWNNCITCRQTPHIVDRLGRKLQQTVAHIFLRDVLIIAEMLNPKNITIILVGKVTFRPQRMMVLGRVWPKAGDKRATLAFQSEICCIYLWYLFLGDHCRLSPRLYLYSLAQPLIRSDIIRAFSLLVVGQLPLERF
jgi:hypothetical protein